MWNPGQVKKVMDVKPFQTVSFVPAVAHVLGWHIYVLALNVYLPSFWLHYHQIIWTHFLWNACEHGHTPSSSLVLNSSRQTAQVCCKDNMSRVSFRDCVGSHLSPTAGITSHNKIDVGEINFNLPLVRSTKPFTQLSPSYNTDHKSFTVAKENARNLLQKNPPVFMRTTHFEFMQSFYLNV